MMDLRERLDAAEGVRKADLVLLGGQLVNVSTGEIYPADVAVAGEWIAAVGDVDSYVGPATETLDVGGRFLAPGLIDGHLHLECSKLSVTMFADAVVPYGTTSVVSGLDQTYVVAGLDGVRDALAEAGDTPLKVFWAAPFKVPYTVPESNVGFRLGPDVHEVVQQWPECWGVWETVTEFITNRDPDVLKVLELAASNRLPVFGSNPMTGGTRLAMLAAAGVRLDHESYDAAELLEKMRAGLYVMIRESAVAHLLEENIQVVTKLGANPGRVGFCTDDVTATSILGGGHLDRLVRMAIAAGVAPITAIQMATINCAQMYRIDHLVGSISPGRAADMLVIDHPKSFNVEVVVAKGQVAAKAHRSLRPPRPPLRHPALLDTMRRTPLRAGEIELTTALSSPVRVLAMEMDPVVPFIRRRHDVVLSVVDGVVQADPAQDALYVAVVERYGKNRPVAVAVIRGFGLSSGALATSAAPDDNNIVCVGTNAPDMAVAVNRVIGLGGGLVVVDSGAVVEELALPVSGIVADLDAQTMAAAEERLDAAAAKLGCRLPSAFGYLMFLEITSIPDYAITDLGLVDCRALTTMHPVLGPA
ncbi:MAG: adenine deaminase C-terminal domain-containing protein [Acidimicrobiales bacterium]